MATIKVKQLGDDEGLKAPDAGVSRVVNVFGVHFDTGRSVTVTNVAFTPGGFSALSENLELGVGGRAKTWRRGKSMPEDSDVQRFIKQTIDSGEPSSMIAVTQLRQKKPGETKEAWIASSRQRAPFKVCTCSRVFLCVRTDTSLLSGDHQTVRAPR
jgi:hypothetical protein